jgi:hypothetical protein
MSRTCIRDEVSSNHGRETGYPNCGSSQTLQANFGLAFRLSYDRFLPNTPRFIMEQSLYNSALYGLGKLPRACVKMPKKQNRRL